MSNSYASLPLHKLKRKLEYFQPIQDLPDHVTMDSPAVLVMTDLRQVTALTIEADVPVEWALTRMKERGVHLLLVTDSHHLVQGLLTSTDIQGEKSMQLIKQLGAQRTDLRVRDIMVSANQLEVLSMAQVLEARVGDVIATLKRARRRHALVEDTESRTQRPAVRGIFSITQIGKQLALAIEPLQIAATFAELRAILSESKSGV